MELEDLSCNVCLETYQPKRVPRNLNCGHSVCTPCLDKILSENKECPECRFKLDLQSSISSPVGYPLLRLATSYINNLSIQSSPDNKSYSKGSKRLLDVGECENHGSLMFFMCMSCEKWVCRDCLVVDHPQGTHANSKCRILNIKEALQEMKKTNADKINEGIQSMESVKKELESLIQDTAKTKSVCQFEINYLESKLQEKKNKLQTITACNEDTEHRIEELKIQIASFENAKSSIENIELPLDVASAITDIKNCHESISSILEDDRRFIKLNLPKKKDFPATAPGFTFPATAPRFTFPATALRFTFSAAVPKSLLSATEPGFSGFGIDGTLPSSTIKFKATKGIDIMQRNAISTNITTYFQVITLMEEYKNASFEEIRVKDYLATAKFIHHSDE